jgi:hypothetical protein
MYKRLLGTALIFGLASAAPPPIASFAHAQEASQPRIACAPRAALVEKLESAYAETRAGAGLKSDSQLLEIWASAETGTWTVLITRADGSSCIVASGTHWLKDAPEIAGLGVRG